MIVEEKVITAKAAHCDPRSQREVYPPLTKRERQSIMQEVTDACMPGTRIDILRKAPDTYLCMALVTVWSMQFCLKAMGRMPGERIRTVADPVLH